MGTEILADRARAKTMKVVRRKKNAQNKLQSHNVRSLKV